jgi:hypothetical protein
VKYDGGEGTPVTELEWEAVDQGFNFLQPGLDEEVARAIYLRKIRGTHIDVYIKKTLPQGKLF